MATLYSTIYDEALAKMREYAFLKMDDERIYAILAPYLRNAESDFTRICIEDLTTLAYDDDGNAIGYADTLSNESIDILSLGVVCYWTTAYVADADKWRNALGTKDFTVFSPANLLNVTKETRDNFLMEYHDKINRYSYLYGNLIRPEVGGDSI